MPKWLIWAALSFTALAGADAARAAACCTSATAFGTGRLLMWESWAAGLRSQFNHELGFYSPQGVFEAGDANSVDQHIRLDAYALVATSEHGSLFVVVPWLFPRLGDTDNINIGSNISDVQLGYRHQVIAIGEFEELPSLALSASVLLPTGTPRNRGVKAHEVTGKDAVALMAGASLEKTWMPFFVQLNLGASFLFNRVRTQNKTPDPYSTSYQVALATGMELTSDLVTSLIGMWTYESPGKYRTEAAASLAWKINSHFTLQAQASSDLFVNGLGSQWPANISYGFGIRYGYF